MIPYARHNGAPMTPEQCAEWLGCDVETMNREHDPMHFDLCAWLGVPSVAVSGRHDSELAELEEHAVLAVQRLMCHWRRERQEWATPAAASVEPNATSHTASPSGSRHAAST